jgi:PhnB protein
VQGEVVRGEVVRREELAHHLEATPGPVPPHRCRTHHASHVYSARFRMTKPSNGTESAMKAVNPYLNLPGTSEEAFTFYRSVFGGEFSVVRYRDFPDNPMGVAEADLDKIANIALPIGGNTVLMATDVVGAFPTELRRGNDFHITLEPDTKDEAGSLFQALSSGGQVTMPLRQTEWAELFGEVTDRFGVQWMINFKGAVEYP